MPTDMSGQKTARLIRNTLRKRRCMPRTGTRCAEDGNASLLSSVMEPWIGVVLAHRCTQPECTQTGRQEASITATRTLHAPYQATIAHVAMPIDISPLPMRAGQPVSS